MKKIVRDLRFWFLVAMVTASVAITVAKIADLNWLIFQDEFDFAYAALLMFLFFAPVVITTWAFGFKRGVFACFIIGLFMFLQVIDSLQDLDLLAGVIAIVAIGISASWLVARQERGERSIRQSAEKLKCQAVELGSELAERKRVEAALRASEEKYRRLFELSPIGITTVDMKGVITSCSPAVFEEVGYSEEEIVGKHFSQIAPLRLRDIPKYTGIFHSIIRGKIPKPFEVAYKREDGTTGWTEIYIALLKEGGKKLGIQVLQRDITKRKQAEEQLQHSQVLASMGEMTAGIAHEVNNPLASILLYSELLMADGIPRQFRKDLKVIHDEAKRAAKIMTALLTYSRRVKPQMRRLDLHSVLRKALAMRRYEQRVQNISISTNLLGGPLYVKGNSSQLTQVFINLMLNAEEAPGERNSGNIIITTQIDGERAKVSIADDGTGIPEENLGWVFHPFFTTKSIGEGTGLGLSTCYGIVTSHDGLIRAENNEMGGATFTVALPLAETRRKVSLPRERKRADGAHNLAVMKPSCL